MTRNKKPVAVVRNGVCSGCHMTISVGYRASLAGNRGPQQCSHCGRFLYLPETKPDVAVAEPVLVKAAPKKRASKKPATLSI